jgi:hypothetical protein
MKRAGKIGGDFEFHVKKLFWSPIIFDLHVIGPFSY